MPTMRYFRGIRATAAVALTLSLTRSFAADVPVRPEAVGDGGVSAETTWLDRTRRLDELFRLGNLYFAAANFEAEVETRRELVQCCTDLHGATNSRTATERQFLRSAEKALAAPRQLQLELRAGRLAYVRARELMTDGDLDAAVAEFAVALAKGEQVLGKDAFCADVRRQLGGCYCLLGRHEDAITVLQQAYHDVVAIYGEHHDYAADVLFRMADAYVGLGRMTDAEVAGVKAFEIAKASADSPSSHAGAFVNLAAVYNSCRKYHSAVDAAKNGVEIIRFVGGDEAKLVYYRARLELAAAYIGDKQAAAARSVHEGTISDIGEQTEPWRWGDVKGEAQEGLASLRGLNDSAD